MEDQREAQISYVLRTVEERDIRFIRLWFTDVLGFLKSFAITPAELQTAFDQGMGFDGSAIEGFARVQESDMVAIPEPSTFQILPAVNGRVREPPSRCSKASGARSSTHTTRSRRRSTRSTSASPTR